MLRPFAKALLVATSLAPVLGAYGINAISAGQSTCQIVRWFIIAGCLLAICLLIMEFMKKHEEIQTLAVKSIRTADQEVLAFLVAYLLPLIAKDTLGIEGDIWTILYVFALVFVAIYHNNSYHFNPLLGLCGYHFYEIEADDGMSFLLVTRQTLRKQRLSTRAVQLTDYMFLDLGDTK